MVILMKKKMSFKNKILFLAIIITFVPLLLSYLIFISSKLTDINENIKNSLREVGYSISNSELIKEKLNTKTNDGSVQEYTKGYIENLNNIDIIVVGDMTGEKYSHLDESQIGKIYVNEDNKRVIRNADSYYSVMEGSMGITLRWFEPIFFEGKQVGFVMVGKYYNDITVINLQAKVKYLLLFIFSMFISMIGAKILSNKVKKSILNMEPFEIAALYREKNIILNSVKDGIISLNKYKKVIELNKNCYRLFKNFDVKYILEKLDYYIDKKEEFEMKEFIILDKKIFVTMKHIYLDDNCLRTIITLIDKHPINKIAKEITGVDEVVKNLRANVHEFKNSLHVILGLLQIKAYEEAKNYILRLQKVQENSTKKFYNIKDKYVRGLLIRREFVARETKLELNLTDESFLEEDHGIIDSNDIVTILGNLIENAFEACSLKGDNNKRVEISLYEDESVIEMQVRDNGIDIDLNLRNRIFKEGISSKGEGRGTGLYLVKNRVELYNGNIDIEEFDGEKIFVITILKGEEK